MALCPTLAPSGGGGIVGGVRYFLLMLAMVALNLPAFAAGTFIGKVTKVTDGDTINVVTTDNKSFKIRLEGIDAPESGQSLGDKSKGALSAKVLGKQVNVTWSKLDIYQRLLAHITVGGQWVNKEMVAEGWAWHYVQYSKDQQLAAAQITARSTRKGLWATKNPVAPWEWRKRPKTGGPKVKAGVVRIVSLVPNPKGKDAGREQVTLTNTSKKAVTLRSWSLKDKGKNVFNLAGTIKANGQLVITMRSNSMPLNNDGDTITLLEGKTVRQIVSYRKQQAGDGKVVKAGKK